MKEVLLPQANGERISGIFSPTLTSYNPDGSVNLPGVRRFVRYLMDAGVDGLAPLGSAAEPVALTVKERMEILEAIVQEVDGRIPIYAGTGHYSTDITIELSKHAKSIGCDGLMLMAPYLLRPPKRDVLNYFRQVHAAVDLPVMMYNVPVLTGCEVTPAELKVLAADGVIHAVKWSHSEVSRIHDTRLFCGPDFKIFAGVDVIAFEALAVGADGWISGLPMIVPSLAVKIHRLLKHDNNLEAARELWYRVLPIIHVEYRAMGTDANDPHWLSVCREAADIRGLDMGAARLPFTAVLPEVREELKQLLTGLGQL
ncbi:MAG: dihydrodipicolinate synthase family protein [Bryobacteraceae bacterium]